MGKYLDEIDSPSDIRKLNISQMKELAEELRGEIISRVSQNGGHLSSNLGVIELTISLLSKFDVEGNDQIVFDVGHQSYAYKLLTGRKDRFDTLRQFEGISGFPRRAESPYDFFDTGHSSTSISAALGLLRAKRLKGDSGKVIAVIGDGALTGGLAYEALNDAGQFGENLIVIINDNLMSIDHNVGALARKLASMRSSWRYIHIKTVGERVLLKIPILGKALLRLGSFLKDSVRIAMRANHPVIFEDLGFRYYGPIDGHNLPTLLRYVETVKNINKPIILHVCTQKGKGYEYAEAEPSQYHGVAPFDVELGCPAGGCSSFTSAFSQTLVDIARREPRVVAVCAAMKSSTGLDAFQSLFHERFFDVGIAEEHCLTMSAGLAVNGMIPVVVLYSTFLQRGFDQLLHDICLQKLHVVIAVDRAGIVGADGETHQGLYDLPMLLTMPGIEVFAPRDYDELERMMNYAVFEAKGPVAVRYPRASESVLFRETAPDAVTKAQMIRKGSAATILSVGILCEEAFRAGEILSEEGIECDCFDLRRVKPLDADAILNSAQKTGIVVCCEDGMYNNGVAAHVSLLLDSVRFPVRFFPIGVNDHSVPAGSRSFLIKREGMDAESIAETIRKAIRNT